MEGVFSGLNRTDAWKGCACPHHEGCHCRRLSAPRLREVFHRLAAGDNEKQAALALGLTRNTLHQYVKEIYRRFEVNSRYELLIHAPPPLVHDAAQRTVFSEGHQRAPAPPRYASSREQTTTPLLVTVGGVCLTLPAGPPERRHAQRVDVVSRVLLISLDRRQIPSTFKLWVSNISESGIGLIATTALPVNTRVRLRIADPGLAESCHSCRICHCNPVLNTFLLGGRLEK